MNLDQELSWLVSSPLFRLLSISVKAGDVLEKKKQLGCCHVSLFSQYADFGSSALNSKRRSRASFLKGDYWVFTLTNRAFVRNELEISFVNPPCGSR